MSAVASSVASHRSIAFGQRPGMKFKLALLSMAALTQLTQAQPTEFPTRAITLVVNANPGGNQDQWARVLATKMGTVLGQPVVVLNKAGAGGAVALTYLANAKPDGYTIGSVQTSSLILLPRREKTAYSLTDFTYIAGAADQPYCLCVSEASPIKSLSDLKTVAQKKSGQLTFGHNGIGHITELIGEATFRTLGVQAVGVPYKGDSEIVLAMRGGHIDIGSLASSFAPQARAGVVIPLAIAAKKRLAAFPDVPLVTDLGVPLDPRLTGLIGYAAPKGLPPDIANKLQAAMAEAIKSDEFKAAVEKYDSTLNYQTGATFAKEVEELDRVVANLQKNLGK